MKEKGMKEKGMNRLTGGSWQNLLAALVLLISISAAGELAAQTEKGAGAQGGTKGADADAKQSWDASQRVFRMIEEWKRTDPVGRHFQKRHSKSKDKIILIETVIPAELGTQDKRWGKARSLAYTKAFTQAMHEYVWQRRARETSRLLRNYLAEDLDSESLDYQRGESADDVMSRFWKKTVALGERKLDKELEESGMSADEIERMTAPQKKIAFSDKISKESTSVAIGSAAGLVPIKTFEAFDDEGNSAIGVVAVVSPRMKHLAGQVAAGKTIRPDGDRLRKPISDQIGPKAISDKELIQEFGPRIMWDEDGYATIVAFGQWAWSSKGLNKRKKSRRRAFAIEQAQSDAIAHLTAFINTSTRFTKVSKRGGLTEEFSLVSADGTVSDEDTVKIIDKVTKTAIVNSDVKLTGLKVQRRGFSRHPIVDGHELVGVIVSWSPAQEDKIRAVEGKRPKHLPPAEKTVQKPRASSGSSKSLDLMKAKDF